jgi:FkbM family methyltransferase
MTVSICIPTCRSREEISAMVCCLEGYTHDREVYASCLPGKSASVNRNNCLDNIAGDIVVMLDDDVAGFYPGWVDDLIEPLNDSTVTIVSARLMNPDGTFGLTMYQGDQKKPGTTDVPRVPTAAVAFRKNNIRFNELYVFATFEDDQFCFEMQEMFGGRIVINNKCRLIHINEQKGQKEGWEHNQKVFYGLFERSDDGTKTFRRSFYRSECGEDKWLDDNIFKGKRDGVFVEAGAIDGVNCSNTYYFEKKLGWTGLCVEPNPAQFAILKKKRTCKVDNSAIYHKPGSARFLAVEGGLTGWGGIVETIEPQHAQRIEKQIKAGDRYEIDVPCITLAEMLKKHDLQKVDFLSLDIEGAEFQVLKQFPFKDFDIDICAIEDNFGAFPIETLMVDKGYQKLTKLRVTDIYRKLESRKINQLDNVDSFWGIPKILNFVWTGPEMPVWAKANIAEFQRLNPDFEVKIHTDGEVCDELRPVYDGITDGTRKTAVQSDIKRLSVLMDGGWYFDCDFWPLVSIKEMCAQMDLSGSKIPLFVRYDGQIAANGILACRKGDAGMKKIIDTTISHIGDPAFQTQKPAWYDYGVTCTSMAFKENPELFERVDFALVAPCYQEDADACRKNVMEILMSEERIKEVKEIGGLAIHYGMCSTIETPDIWPVRNYHE